MKKISTLAVILFTTLTMYCQTPELMSYQAVVRDADSELLTDQAVGMKISILEDTASGTPVYVETQNPSTNSNGLLSLQVGAGTVVSGDITTIDWANHDYFIKTETDPTGGENYTITGTSQLLSVPYALYAKTSSDAGAIAANTTAITTNTTDIATNVTNIAGNTTDIATNGTDIATNASGIATNASGIATNGTDIATNVNDIAANVTAISTNTDNIAINESVIVSNVTVITTNTNNIATNASGISTNATDITTNTNNIATNVTAITTNTSNIAINVTDISTNASGIATNVTDIASNVTAISTNASGIATNVTDIAANSAAISTPIYTVNTFYPDLGGYVIAVRDGGKHGLVVAMQDQGSSSWYEANDLLSNAFNHEVNGAKFMDWRMPTKRELYLMYGVRYLPGLNLNQIYYWSSTGRDVSYAWYLNFNDGLDGAAGKDGTNTVRAVRAF